MCLWSKNLSFSWGKTGLPSLTPQLKLVCGPYIWENFPPGLQPPTEKSLDRQTRQAESKRNQSVRETDRENKEQLCFLFSLAPILLVTLLAFIAVQQQELFCLLIPFCNDDHHTADDADEDDHDDIIWLAKFATTKVPSKQQQQQPHHHQLIPYLIIPLQNFLLQCKWDNMQGIWKKYIYEAFQSSLRGAS